MPGLEEGRLLTGEREPEAIARFYLDRGARLVVIKLGPEGAYYDDGAQRGRVPASPVSRVVDTVGAGDGFAVGVISGRVLRRPDRWVAVPLESSAAPWRAVLRALPAAAPRAIEYPLTGADLAGITGRALDALRRLEQASHDNE